MGRGDTHNRWMASNTMKMEMRMRNMPFANPDKVSIRPKLPKKIQCNVTPSIALTYPYVNCSLGGHCAITDATRPTPIAMQSNAI